MDSTLAMYKCGCLEKVPGGELYEACEEGRELYIAWQELDANFDPLDISLGPRLALVRAKTELWLHLSGEFFAMDPKDYYHEPLPIRTGATRSVA